MIGLYRGRGRERIGVFIRGAEGSGASWGTGGLYFPRTIAKSLRPRELFSFSCTFPFSMLVTIGKLLNSRSILYHY